MRSRPVQCTVLAALLILPSTSPRQVNSATPPRTREGLAGPSLGPAATLANAYVQLEGLAATYPPCL